MFPICSAPIRGLNSDTKEYFHVKALKDLLFVSNQVTQYFSSIVN